MSKFIWTNHSLQRLKDRKISESFAYKTLENPDEKIKNNDGTLRLTKKFEHQTAVAIIKVNEKKENVVLSFWLNPPNPGTQDFRNKEKYREIKRASFFKKFWLTILNQIGL